MPFWEYNIEAVDYLIDGNNLLHAVHPYGPGAPIGREWLCEILGGWARRTASSVAVIFDGAPPPAGLLGQMRATGLEVEFSAPQTADDVIEALIAAAVRPVELHVVTSDHAIQSAARARKCICVDSEVFAETLFAPAEAAPPPPPALGPEKPDAPSPGESDQWLRQFDYDPDQPPDETDLMRY
jgi:hypothetical protein